MPLDTSCLYSTVKNTSGKAAPFSFLPPHGKKLAVNEEYTVFGDIRQAIIRGERTESRRNVIAMERALQRGDMEILHTPGVILEDRADLAATPKMIVLHNNNLQVADACWNTSTSITVTPPIGLEV